MQDLWEVFVAVVNWEEEDCTRDEKGAPAWHSVIGLRQIHWGAYTGKLMFCKWVVFKPTDLQIFAQFPWGPIAQFEDHWIVKWIQVWSTFCNCEVNENLEDMYWNKAFLLGALYTYCWNMVSITVIQFKSYLQSSKMHRVSNTHQNENDLTIYSL